MSDAVVLVPILKLVGISTASLIILFDKQVVSVELGDGKSVTNLQTPLRIKPFEKSKSTLCTTEEEDYEKVSFVIGYFLHLH